MQISLLQDIMRDKMESDDLLMDSAMSGIKFVHRLIASWEGIDMVSTEEDNLDAFSFKAEGALFFLNGERLRELRDQLRIRRRGSDMNCIRNLMEEEPEEQDESDDGGRSRGGSYE